MSLNIQNLDRTQKDRFKKLGVTTLLDLALVTPYSYENTMLTPFPLLNQNNTLQVTIRSSKQTSKLFHVLFWCDTWEKEIDGIFFVTKAYHRAIFKKDTKLYISGKVQKQGAYLQIVQPKIVHTVNVIVPKYKTPLQNKTVMDLMKQYISQEALISAGLNQSQAQVLMNIHFPSKADINLSQSPYLGVLKFVEIFNYLQKLSFKKVSFPSPMPLKGDERSFIASLPFSLTQDQLKVIAEIKQDFLGNNATKRVVMGDVGCGKTMVILASVMMSYPQKAVLMAPTTVLACQLYEEAKKFLPPHIKVVLITQETKDKGMLEEVDFIIGTHALLYQELPRCALVMVDEQHRFGTKQRALLSALVSNKEWHPHYLQFSATPIPRTLGMIQSSLVDFSFIKTLPFPKDITTRVIGRKDFKALIDHLKEEIAKGHQCIIVYPLVEESEMINYQSIEEGRGFWEKHFDNVYVTYGKDKHKEEVLSTFKEKGTLLLATTVVEVGISLPKLSIIVIVGAERLGLASLHQLRGRVSRNGLKGYCYLYTHLPKNTRLEEFSKTLDGFEIAELDLKYRHGGDIVEGQMQSGKHFVWFDMAEDEKILIEAQRKIKEAKRLPIA